MLCREENFPSPRFPPHSSARCSPDLRGRLRPSEGLPWARFALSVTPDGFSGFVSFQCFVEWHNFRLPSISAVQRGACKRDVRGRLAIPGSPAGSLRLSIAPANEISSGSATWMTRDKPPTSRGRSRRNTPLFTPHRKLTLTPTPIRIPRSECVDERTISRIPFLRKRILYILKKQTISAI